MTELKLSVNVDHVATVREARKVGYPDPLEAARLAAEAGAHGITVHLRADRRHIQEHDVASLRRDIGLKLNLEIAATEEMIGIALELKPDQVSLVPERPEEITTEGGLDLLTQGERVATAVRRLNERGIGASLFLDPEPAQLERLEALAGQVSGFEINTDAYTRAAAAGSADAELAKVAQAARTGHKQGLRVYAGHGLTCENVVEIAALREIEELNIGHYLIGRAVMVGMKQAVREMLAAMDRGRARLTGGAPQA